MVGRMFSVEALKSFKETLASKELEQFLERNIENLTGKLITCNFSEGTATPIEYQSQIKVYRDMLNQLKTK